MRYVKIKEVAEVIMGQSPDSNSYNDKGIGIPFFQGKSEFGKINPIIKMYCTEPKKTAQPLDILMSVRAPVGDVNISNIDCCIGRGLCSIRSKENINYKYLYYYLLTQKKNLENQSTGSTFKAINKNIILDIEIPITDIETQNKIVEVLDKAQDLIDKKIEQIDLLDELVKSRFIEMFGNVISNSKHWKMKQLKDIAILKSGGTPSRKEPKYFQGEIPWITTVSLGKNIIDENDAVEFITQEAIEKSSTKLIESNSLLFGMRVGVGKISINKIPMCTNQDIVAITKIDENEYNLICLKKIIENYSDYFNNQKRGATIQGIKSETLKNINIPILPIELQNEFAVFVEKIDSIKAAAEKSLEQLNDNFNSLIQKAFKGELF